MPTGAGKSALAELAVAQAVSAGWVLYLAPTRALVSQVRRDLRTALGGAVEVREYLGGAEFTALADEQLDADAGMQVLVMTPEKCSLALRLSPEAFPRLSLCIFDECHLIGESRGRGALAELVVAQVLSLAPAARFILMSALLGNPEDVAAWLTRSNDLPCAVIREPWRPTRTLRAIAGFDPTSVDTNSEAPIGFLRANPKRINKGFRASVNLLAHLQGAWASAVPADYALAYTSITAPLNVRRTRQGLQVDGGGYVNAATGAIAQALGEAGERVLAFLPRNKHYSFSVARDIGGFGAVGRDGDAQWEELGWYLDLADYELGSKSALRELLEKGVAVHTSAMLQTERRASELAYDRGFARVVFATGTLAQGLNLPATAVIIGGITVGFDPSLSQQEKQRREQAQLLNAVGRAGRAYVASRSIAIVLPDKAYRLGSENDGVQVRARAPFLQQEDASAPVRSQLGKVVDDAIAGRLTVDTMGEEGLTAFAFLPLRSDRSEAESILARSFAVSRRQSTSEAEVARVAATMVGFGERILTAADAPEWLVEVAYEAGLPVGLVVQLWERSRELVVAPFPSSIQRWADLLVDVLAAMPYDVVAAALPLDSLDGTRMSALANPVATARHVGAWSILRDTIRGWLSGLSLTELADVAVKVSASQNTGRGSGNPLPKIINLTEHLMNFGLTRVAGGFTAMLLAGVERDQSLGWTFSTRSTRALSQLSLALRAGCEDDGSLLWWRYGGVRHRRLAHLASRLMPPSGELAFAEDDEQRKAMSGQFDRLVDPDDLLTRGLTDDERKALTALALITDI
jgi:hypothetical protein